MRYVVDWETLEITAVPGYGDKGYTTLEMAEMMVEHRICQMEWVSKGDTTPNQRRGKPVPDPFAYDV